MKPADDRHRSELKLPLHQFFYTFEQIAYMTGVQERTLAQNYVYYTGRDFGPVRGRIRATNIAPDGVKPEWRVAEENFVYWCRSKKINVKQYKRGQRISANDRSLR